MALTSVVLNPGTIKPKDVAYLSVTAAANLGFAFSLSATASQSPTTVRVTGDADWFWSYQDGQTAATTSMVRVRADQIERIMFAPAGVTIYCRTAAGTSNLWVVQEF